MSRISGEPNRFIYVGEFTIDRRTGLMEASGLRERLRRKEIELLCYLFQYRSRPVGRRQLLEDVWQCPNMITRTVDQTVSTLRRKLRDGSGRHLVTVHGIGYQLVTAGLTGFAH